jgi:hypothetical protein
MPKLPFVLSALASLTISTFAQPDTQFRSAIRGYWHTARHTYLYKGDGLILMEGAVNGHWSISGGILYEQSVFYGGKQASKSGPINDRPLIYKGLTGDDAGHVMTLYRTTRP